MLERACPFLVPLVPQSALSAPPPLPHPYPPAPPPTLGQGGVRQERQLDSLEKKTEMASGYSLCELTHGGTNLAPRQPQPKTD